jgi:hypothetical protein
VGFLYSMPIVIKILKIRRTPTTWIDAIPEKGRVEILGKVGQQTILSPINNKPCALWQIDVKQATQGRHGTHWEIIYKHASSEPFEVYDDTGAIRIQPDHVTLFLDQVVESYTLDAQQKKKLEEFGIKLTNLFGTEKVLEVSEYLIEPDKDIYINGEVQNKTGQKVISGKSGDSVIISDRQEAKILGGYYRKLGTNLFWAAITGAAIILLLIRYGYSF